MPVEMREHTFGRSVNTYDWDTWLDGKIRKFVQGTDFACTLDSFRKSAYVAAYERGLKVNTSIVQEGKEKAVILKAVRAEEKAPPKAAKPKKSRKKKDGDSNS